MQQLSYYTMTSSAIQLVEPNAGKSVLSLFLIFLLSTYRISLKKDRDVTKAPLLTRDAMGADGIISTLYLQC